MSITDCCLVNILLMTVSVGSLQTVGQQEVLEGQGINTSQAVGQGQQEKEVTDVLSGQESTGFQPFAFPTRQLEAPVSLFGQVCNSSWFHISHHTVDTLVGSDVAGLVSACSTSKMERIHMVNFRHVAILHLATCTRICD